MVRRMRRGRGPGSGTDGERRGGAEAGAGRGRAGVRAGWPRPCPPPLTSPDPGSGWYGRPRSARSGRPLRGFRFEVSRRAPRVWPCARPCALARSVRKRFHGCCVGRPAALDTAGWGKPPPHSPQAVDRSGRRTASPGPCVGPGVSGRGRCPARRNRLRAGGHTGVHARVRVRVRAGGCTAQPNRFGTLSRSAAVRDLVRCGPEQPGRKAEEGGRGLLAVGFQRVLRLAECRRSSEVGPTDSRTSRPLSAQGVHGGRIRAVEAVRAGEGNTRNP